VTLLYKKVKKIKVILKRTLSHSCKFYKNHYNFDKLKKYTKLGKQSQMI